MIDFFISYTQTDEAWAEWIAGVLQAAGYETKLQVWDFRPGVNFIGELHRTVDEAERTLVVLSPDYLNSRFGEAEWMAAFRRDPTGELGKILPVRVREVEPPGLLRSIVYIDLVGLEHSAARERLLSGLARGRAIPSALPGFPGGLPLPDPVAAVSWLASLPVDEIPERRPLPPGSSLPFPPNPFFVGRLDDLRTLARQLKGGEVSAIGHVEPAAATGLGGIGKTQLACEFAHRYGRYFAGGVFWMSFADPAAVPTEVAASGRWLNLDPRYEELPVERQVDLVRQAWQSPLPRLLVFDNCEEEELLDRWRPPFGGARVLLTSRRARWEPTLGVRVLALGTLTRAESLELLRKYRPDLPADDPALGAIADELGDLPLALHLAGSFLARYADAAPGRPSEYLASLRRSGLLDHPSLQGKASKISPTRHEANVARTFALSFERLEPGDATDALAIVLLRRVAWLAPGEPIPRELLFALAGIGQANADAALRGEDALGRLTELGLLESQGGRGWRVHQLVAAFAQRTTESEEDRVAVEQAVTARARGLVIGFPHPLSAWESHLRVMAQRAWEREDAIVASLCNILGSHLQQIGDYTGALPYLERALAVRRKVLGPEHADTSESLNNLGVLLRSLGDLAGARACQEEALAIRARAGPESLDSATTLNNLGVVLRMQDDLAAAHSCLTRALAIRSSALGPEHPDTAQSMMNLAMLLRKEKDFTTALSLNEQALAIRETALGPEHPDVAKSLSVAGSLFRQQGDLAKAREYFTGALKLRERLLGPEHPDVVYSLNVLGGLLVEQKNLVEALPLLRRVLEIRERSLGPEHPETVSSLSKVGFVLWKQGNFAAARPCYERLLPIREKLLGPEHLSLARLHARLGTILRELNDLEGARLHRERALAIREKALGPEHPDVARSLNDLGFVLWRQGDRAAARRSFERALAIDEAQLGPEHPHTKLVRKNLTALDAT
jgi:tetratricopeptide (TPR) repeat protein